VILLEDSSRWKRTGINSPILLDSGFSDYSKLAIYLDRTRQDGCFALDQRH